MIDRYQAGLVVEGFPENVCRVERTPYERRFRVRGGRNGDRSDGSFKCQWSPRFWASSLRLQETLDCPLLSSPVLARLMLSRKPTDGKKGHRHHRGPRFHRCPEPNLTSCGTYKLLHKASKGEHGLRSQSRQSISSQLNILIRYWTDRFQRPQNRLGILL